MIPKFSSLLLLSKAPYKTFEVEGWTILVGRSAADNDILSLEVANSQDFWLHVADYPGSHVVVRNPEGYNVMPRPVMEEALRLAVQNSRAKGMSGVEVVLGRAGDLSKPEGAAGGEINISKHTLVKTAAPKLFQPPVGPRAKTFTRQDGTSTVWWYDRKGPDKKGTGYWWAIRLDSSGGQIGEAFNAANERELLQQITYHEDGQFDAVPRQIHKASLTPWSLRNFKDDHTNQVAAELFDRYSRQFPGNIGKAIALVRRDLNRTDLDLSPAPPKERVFEPLPQSPKPVKQPEHQPLFSRDELKYAADAPPPPKHFIEPPAIVHQAPQNAGVDYWYGKIRGNQIEQQYGLKPGVLKHLMDKESKGNPLAKNRSGAKGLFQIMPKRVSGFDGNPYDPVQAAHFAAKTISTLVGSLGSYEKAFAAYNWGVTNLKRYGLENAPRETLNFVNFFKNRGVA
jgi:soluble lytic murein transglycosylase-like protein